MPKLRALRTLLGLFRIWGVSERGFASATVGLVSLATGATLLAGSVMASGTLSSDQLEATVRDGLARAGGTVEVRGSVVARTAGKPLVVTEIEMTIDIAGLGAPVLFDHDSVVAGRALVSLATSDSYVADAGYTARSLSGNADLLLEPGELFELQIDATPTTGWPRLKPGDRLTIEITSAIGGVVSISRTLPTVFDPVISLH
jgi:archaellin